MTGRVCLSVRDGGVRAWGARYVGQNAPRVSSCTILSFFLFLYLNLSLVFSNSIQIKSKSLQNYEKNQELYEERFGKVLAHFLVKKFIQK
jgi:uncharacterized pyridoxamine 5'-phosphate oxidase family protein